MNSKFGFSLENFENFKDNDSNEFINPYEDPGDLYDSLKWDFPEDSLEVVYIDNYPYKVRKRGSKEETRKKAVQLSKMRKDINKLCDALIDNPELWFHPEPNDFTEGIKIFLDVHGEFKRDPNYVPEQFHKRIMAGRPSSKYLISELPKRGSKSQYPPFLGLNKPKLRHITGEYPVGSDGSLRCGYRDVFLRHDVKGPELRSLVLHELSHTGANHCQWRDDDHGRDFAQVENLLTKLANEYKIKLMI